MPNPFHYRAKIDRLWRRTAEHNPGYIRLKALNTIVRELHRPNSHRPGSTTSSTSPPTPTTLPGTSSATSTTVLNSVRPPPLGEVPRTHAGWRGPHPTLTQVAPAQAGAAPTEEESPEEDDDPL